MTAPLMSWTPMAPTVERLGIVPKKKRVVLTDKELFEDDIWLASREKRDDDDEDVPEELRVARRRRRG